MQIDFGHLEKEKLELGVKIFAFMDMFLKKFFLFILYDSIVLLVGFYFFKFNY